MTRDIESACLAIALNLSDTLNWQWSIDNVVLGFFNGNYYVIGTKYT